MDSKQKMRYSLFPPNFLSMSAVDCGLKHGGSAASEGVITKGDTTESAQRSFTADEVHIILADAERLDAVNRVRPEIAACLDTIDDRGTKGLTETGLMEMADTLSISRESLAQAIRLRQLTDDDVREDARTYGTRERPEIYMRRLRNYLLQKLQEAYPEKKFSDILSAPGFSPDGRDIRIQEDARKHWWDPYVHDPAKSFIDWADISCYDTLMICVVKDPRFLRLFGDFLRENPYSPSDVIQTSYPTA